MKKIGIMGGTFDPPHIGHLIVAEYVADKLKLDKVLFIPTGQIKYKSSACASANDRLKMTELATMDNPIFEVSDIEVKREGVTYSADTLELLCKSYAGEELYFIVGADSLDYMDKWKDPERLFSYCKIVAVGRRGFEESGCRKKIKQLNEDFNARIELLNVPLIEISSTEIRDRAKKGMQIKYMVSSPVEKYIKDNKLYLGD